MTSFTRVTNDLSISELLGVLQLKPKLLLLGYGLSEEDQIPQFDGILKGVWSRSPGNINPFTNPLSKDMLFGWFGWRMSLIRRKNHSHHFFAAERLVEALGIDVLATQTVDGQIKQDTAPNVLELFGNTFNGLCVHCEAAYGPLAIQQLESGKHASCKQCAGEIFPDVSMFEWNKKEDIRTQFLSAYHSAQVVISVAGDPELTPEIAADSFGPGSRKQLLELEPDRITLRSSGSGRYATYSTLAKMAEAKFGHAHPLNSGNGYRNGITFLTGLTTLAATNEQ